MAAFRTRSRTVFVLLISLCSSTCHCFLVHGESRRTFVSPIPLQPNDRVVIDSSESDDKSFDKGTYDASYGHSLVSDSSSSLTHTQRDLKRRRMDLFMCDREHCTDIIRERVSGHANHMAFDGPATGQVCYVWEDHHGTATERQSVLLLVRPGDETLMALAGHAVQELVQDGIQVYLAPDLAAKLIHNHGVEDRQNFIKLYEPLPVPGFGGNHVSVNDTFMGEAKHKDAQQNPDLICTLGGDGLLMHASMMFSGPVPPILCVAGGSLGFLTPFSRDEMVDAIRIALGIMKREHAVETRRNPVEIRPFMLQEKLPSFQLGSGNRICLSMRMRLDCRVINREGVVRARFNVLNEVVIDRGNSPYLAALECFCDDVHLTTVQADGIIFATPTGSTAYSMAAGGSVVHPAVPAILVTPICPHVLSFRSMIFPDSVVLRCYVPDDARADASVAFDGRYRRTLHRGDSVQIQMSIHPVPTINRVDHSADWLYSLKENFNFNTRARQMPLG